MDNENQRLSINETLSQLRIGRTTLYSLIRSGQIEAVKLGRRTLVSAQSANDFLRNLPRMGE